MTRIETMANEKLDTLLAAVQELHDGVCGTRSDIGGLRAETGRLAGAVARLATETSGLRAETRKAAGIDDSPTETHA